MRDNTFSGPDQGEPPDRRPLLAIGVVVILLFGYLYSANRGPDLTPDQAAAARVAKSQLVAFVRNELPSVCSRMLEWDTKWAQGMRDTARAHGGIEDYVGIDRVLTTQLTGSWPERCLHYETMNRRTAKPVGILIGHPQQASPVVNDRTVLTYGYGEGTVVVNMRRVDGRWMQERSFLLMPE